MRFRPSPAPDRRAIRRGRRSRQQLTTAPTVLIASMATYEAGDQLAASLRRFGVRAELFRPPADGRLARMLLKTYRLVYREVHETGFVAPASGAVALAIAERASKADVVSVEATDETAGPLVDYLADAFGQTPTLGRSTATDELVLGKLCEANDAPAMFNKHWQTKAAEQAGISVPRTWQDPTRVDQFPVLIKPRLGGGGEGIQRASTDVELREIWASLNGPSGTHYIQQEIAGETIQVGGVSAAGTPVVISAYRGDTNADSPFGQIGTFQLLDLPEDVDLVSQILRRTGYTGAFCVDLIKDREGHSWFLEINARLFGSWMGLQLAGVDFVGAYRYAYGLGPEPASQTRDYTTIWELKHPDTRRTSRLALAGFRRAGTMMRTLGYRGVALMLTDLAAHIRRTTATVSHSSPTATPTPAPIRSD